MHIATGRYDDFKRMITGTGVVPPPLFDPQTGKPLVGAVPTGPIDPVTGKPVPAKVKAAAVVMKGQVYHWGGTVASGDWGCVFVSTDNGIVITSRSVSGASPPPTFDADFPDAIELASSLTLTP